ncbi:unannotated protein [freshwater metagenome]|uniref:Unannotated protein n=1 Tax=freshwater metagenome TaxID=449393 RepID=A0A6J6UB87_9ZZZZ
MLHEVSHCHCFATLTLRITCVKSEMVSFSDHMNGKQRRCGSTEFRINLQTCCGPMNLSALKNKLLMQASECQFWQMPVSRVSSTDQSLMHQTATHILGQNAACEISFTATHLVSVSLKVAEPAKQLLSGFSMVAQNLICGQLTAAVTRHTRQRNTRLIKQLRFIKTNTRWVSLLKSDQRVGLHTCLRYTSN